MRVWQRFADWVCGRAGYPPIQERNVRDLERASAQLGVAVDKARTSVERARDLVDVMDQIVARVQSSTREEQEMDDDLFKDRTSEAGKEDSYPNGH